MTITDKRKMYRKLWLKNHPDKNSIYLFKYRNTLKGKLAKKADSAKQRIYQPAKKYNLTREKVLSVFLKSKGLCFYCKEPITELTFTIDHKQPLCKNGTHHANNLVACCKKCNDAKQHRTLKEFKEIKKNGFSFSNKTKRYFVRCDVCGYIGNTKIENEAMTVGIAHKKGQHFVKINRRNQWTSWKELEKELNKNV